MEGWLDKALHWTTLGMEVVGILIIVVGALFATATALLKRFSRRGGPRPYEEYRANLGRAILLGLEVLVAADIINTVAIEPTLQSVAILAGIVLIRTFLSFSLEVEIQGRWPWEQRRMRGSQEHQSRSWLATFTGASGESVNNDELSQATTGSKA